jgi:hypothetical protein
MYKYYVDPCDISVGGGLDTLLYSKFYREKIRIFPFKHIDFDENSAVSDIDCLLNFSENYKKIYVSGNLFNFGYLLEDYHNDFSRRYSLKEEYYNDNKFVKKIATIKKEDIKLVGVHIRRTDYIQWQNGRYYFDDEVYKKNMEIIQKQINFKFGKEVFFIIFSDVITSFEKEDNNYGFRFAVSKEPWYIDHHLMSKCDYLIGPPSTFTGWASYIGRNIYMQITDSQKTVSLDNL